MAIATRQNWIEFVEEGFAAVESGEVVNVKTEEEPYEATIIRYIARGSYAQVLLGVLSGDFRLFALKMFRHTAVKTYKRESNTAKMLKGLKTAPINEGPSKRQLYHPGLENIITMYNTFTHKMADPLPEPEDDVPEDEKPEDEEPEDEEPVEKIREYPCIAYELMTGSLIDYLERKDSLTPSEVIRILRDVTKGIDALEYIPFVHSDIKGDNILYKEVGRAGADFAWNGAKIVTLALHNRMDRRMDISELVESWMNPWGEHRYQERRVNYRDVYFRDYEKSQHGFPARLPKEFLVFGKEVHNFGDQDAAWNNLKKNWEQRQQQCQGNLVFKLGDIDDTGITEGHRAPESYFLNYVKTPAFMGYSLGTLVYELLTGEKLLDLDVKRVELLSDAGQGCERYHTTEDQQGNRVLAIPRSTYLMLALMHATIGDDTLSTEYKDLKCFGDLYRIESHVLEHAQEAIHKTRSTDPRSIDVGVLRHQMSLEKRNELKLENRLLEAGYKIINFHGYSEDQQAAFKVEMLRIMKQLLQIDPKNRPAPIQILEELQLYDPTCPLFEGDQLFYKIDSVRPGTDGAGKAAIVYTFPSKDDFLRWREYQGTWKHDTKKKSLKEATGEYYKCKRRGCKRHMTVHIKNTGVTEAKICVDYDHDHSEHYKMTLEPVHKKFINDRLSEGMSAKEVIVAARGMFDEKYMGPIAKACYYYASRGQDEQMTEEQEEQRQIEEQQQVKQRKKR